MYLKNLDLADLMEHARAAVVGQATSILRDDPAADVQYVVLDMPCSFFSLRSLRCDSAQGPYVSASPCSTTPRKVFCCLLATLPLTPACIAVQQPAGCH